MDFSFLIAFPWTRAFLLAFLYALGFYVYFLFSRMIFYNFTIFRDNSYFTFEDFRDFQWFVQYIWEYSKRLIITFTGGLPLFLVICIYGIIILKRMYLNIKKTASNNFSQLIPFYIIFGGILILSPILIEILTIFAFSIFDYSMTSGGRLLPVPANAIFGLLAGFVYGFICGFIPRKKFKWYRFHLKPLFALSFYFAALFIIASTHTTFWRPSDGYRLPLTIKMPEFQKIDIPSLPDIPISKDIKISVGIYRYPKIGKFSILGDIKSTISEVINELINQKNKSNGVLLSILLQEEPHYSGKRGRELLQAIQSEDSNSPLYYKLEAYLNKLSKLSSIKENHSYGINNDQFDHNKKQKIKKTRKVHEL